jgi:hypothetical protein
VNHPAAGVIRDLYRAAQHLRTYQQGHLASQVDNVATGIYTGQIIDRPVQ